MADANLLVTIDDAVALITLNRPAVHNALNGETLSSLAATVADLGSSRDIRAIVITGTGERAFSAGADLDELAGLDSSTAYDVLSAGQRTMAAIESSAVPVIAAVNGMALGGGFELVLACSFPILSKRATLALPESGLGLIPGYGGTQRLPRLIGRSAAAHMMLTGSKLSAQRAYALGLTPVEPVEPEELIPTAMQVARDIAARGPRAQAAILQALQTGAPTREELSLESTLAAIAVGSADAETGIAAFRERRPARFTMPIPIEARTP